MYGVNEADKEKRLAGSGPCHFFPRSAQRLRSLSSLLLLCSTGSPLFASLLFCFQSLCVHRIYLIAIRPTLASFLSTHSLAQSLFVCTPCI
jgi:hypothetical protein